MSDVASLCLDAIKKKVMYAAKGLWDFWSLPSQVGALQLARSVLDKQGLSCSPRLLTLGRHVNAGTNQASLPYERSRYPRLHSKQMQKHSHMRANLNKIKQTFV